MPSHTDGASLAICTRKLSIRRWMEFFTTSGSRRNRPAWVAPGRSDIKIVAEDGRVLLEDHITWDELREMGRKIMITDPEHPPSPTSTPSPGTTPTG